MSPKISAKLTSWVDKRPGENTSRLNSELQTEFERKSWLEACGCVVNINKLRRNSREVGSKQL